VPNSEITDVQRIVSVLRRKVASLRYHFGDVPDVRRLLNDVERLDIDITELHGNTSRPRRTQTLADVVMIPDAPYNPELWQGADDEGVGGYRRQTG
jgi:hypothetical protein